VSLVEAPPRAAALRSACGRTIAMDVARWFDAPRPEEDRVLAHAVPPVLDVGCGPGRHVAALTARGVRAVGIDVAPAAVSAARSRGARVLHRSVFDPLPHEGTWGTALLLDGNVGIGGDPEALLRRIRALLAPGGRALVEVEPPGEGTRRLRVRAEVDGAAASGWFPWAVVGADAVAGVARRAGFGSSSTWHDASRWFARLEAR
jgi:SAM-dependent methyltransferase